MTPREIYLRALDMASPPRAPRDMWTLPWAEKRYPNEIAEIRRRFPGDTVGSPGWPSKPGMAHGDPYAVGSYTDDWGCTFDNIQEGVIGEVKRPQVTQDDWSDAENVHIPYEQLTINREKINDYCRAHHDYLIQCGCCPRPFEQLQFIRGTANLYMDLMDPPEGMLRFIGKMHAFYCEQLEAWAKTDVDVLNFMDDWGSQEDLLIPPRIWEAIFLPMYRDYIDIAHRHGKRIFMHSDGNTLKIFPALIDAGLDAINSQIFCIGVEKLAPFRGKITFWGEIDRQHLLPHGTPAQIDAAVQLVRDTLWDHGGCVAQFEFGPGGNPDNARRIFEAWEKAV